MTSLDEHAWELLLERISAQRCTPFLGAGFSAHPKGADIAHRWARRVPVSTALESPTGPPGPAEARLDPYVGPEPFRREDAWRFFGRREQAEELLSFVIASRTVSGETRCRSRNP